MRFDKLLSKCHGKNDSRPYWINLGLFYPGILGALIYEAGPRLYSLPWTWDSSKILIFVMLTHYALDYAYSVDEKNKSDYTWCKFPFDFIVVWLLYAALKTAAISPLEPSDVLQICWLLLATKACALFWELLNNAHPDKCAKHLAIASDLVPLLGYGILFTIFKNGSLVPEGLVNLLIVVVIVDAALYWVHEPIYRLLKDG